MAFHHSTETTICIGDNELEGVTVEFNADQWQENVGHPDDRASSSVSMASCDMTFIQLGDLKITRDQAIKMLGDLQVEIIEAQAAEELAGA